MASHPGRAAHSLPGAASWARRVTSWSRLPSPPLQPERCGIGHLRGECGIQLLFAPRVAPTRRARTEPMPGQSTVLCPAEGSAHPRCRGSILQPLFLLIEAVHGLLNEQGAFCLAGIPGFREFNISRSHKEQRRSQNTGTGLHLSSLWFLKLRKHNGPARACPNAAGGEGKRVLAPSPPLPPSSFPFWPTKPAVGAGRETCPPKAAVDSGAEPSRQMVLARLRISLRWQVLGSAILGTTSLGSLSSLHVLRRLETSFFPREGRGWSLELPCLHRAVKVSCGRLPGSRWVGCLPMGTRAWTAPAALAWGPGGHLGAGGGGEGEGWGWAVLQLQGKMCLIFEDWRCSIVPRNIFPIAG